jgi:hypothetical protein
MKVLGAIIQWIIMLAVIVGIVLLFKHVRLPAITLSSIEIIILAFSCAFVWVYVLKWGVIKPFNCVTCMTGWFSLIIGCWAIGKWGVVYMPVGMTVAALYSEIRMRWL